MVTAVRTNRADWMELPLKCDVLGIGNVFSYTHGTNISRCGLLEVLLTVLKTFKEISKI